MVLKQILSEGQCSLTLCYKPYVIPLTASHHVGILSSYLHKEGEYSPVRYFERDHIHVTFLTVYYLIVFLLVINLFT